jgi:SH3-like domain-containing protein
MPSRECNFCAYLTEEPGGSVTDIFRPADGVGLVLERCENYWVRLFANGKSGWVHEAYLETVQ